jgi:putative membrane protein
MRILKNLFYGTIIGVANIIPGVSGGTMALVLGFYKRLIVSIHNISPRTIIIFFKVFTFKKENVEKFKDEVKRIELIFLVTITAGALIAIVVLSEIMIYLLNNFHDPTYGFFFGLVLVSVIAPYKIIKKKTISCFFIFLIAVMVILAVSFSASGETLLKKAQIKHEMKKADTQTDKIEKENNKFNILKLSYFFLLGAVAISTMILPGVSGSFLLLLMGGYFTILKAITNRNYIILIIFSAGCLVGIVIFSRFLNFLLKRWHNQTMSFLVGLVIGSLWMIWPFKTSAKVGDEIIYLINRIPNAIGANEIHTFLTTLLGIGIVAAILIIESKKKFEDS